MTPSRKPYRLCVRTLDEFSQESLAEYIARPPMSLKKIRRYGLYVSRTKGRWKDMSWGAERAPERWKARRHYSVVADDLHYEPLSRGEEDIDSHAHKRAWARLLAKVYEVDPLVCPKCGAEMKVIAIIEDPDELTRIPRHLRIDAQVVSGNHLPQGDMPTKSNRCRAFTESHR